jgi:hypothetical protein
VKSVRRASDTLFLRLAEILRRAECKQDLRKMPKDRPTTRSRTRGRASFAGRKLKSAGKLAPKRRRVTAADAASRRRADRARVDIAELKQREASFRVLFDGNPVPMMVCARDDERVLDVNDAALVH